jgi:hypothetical protein
MSTEYRYYNILGIAVVALLGKKKKNQKEQVLRAGCFNDHNVESK